MESLYDELSTIFSDVRILSPRAIQFKTEPPIDVWANGNAAASMPAWYPNVSDPLVRELQGLLYARYYCRAPQGREFRSESIAAGKDPVFLSNLSAAIRGESRWDPDWSIYQVDSDGSVQVQKGDRCRRAAPGEYAGPGGTGAVPRVGTVVSLQVPREAGYLQPGFYFVFGETLSDQFDEFSTVRLYFHATPEGTAPLLAVLTAHLNRQFVPFRIKCLNAPALYTRADGFVLYLARRHFSTVARLLAEEGESLTAGLLAAVPLFAKQLARGVGVAEDPGNGESFGMHRCRLLAEAMVDAARQGAASHEACHEAFRQRLQSNGLRPEAPHLNAGLHDDYSLPEKVDVIL